MSESEALIDVEPMSVDQLAGAFVMIAGAIGSLLLVIWQSKCHCKMNLCYIFSCERRPPNEEEMKSLKQQAKDMKNKKNKTDKEQEQQTAPKEETLIPDDIESQKSVELIPKLETVNLDSPKV
jgi:hypothetical protein